MKMMIVTTGIIINEGDEEVVMMTVNDGDGDAGGGVTWQQVALTESRMQKN